jgi:enoyl-[acyl-carrier-protein] reductase (NADH)
MAERFGVSVDEMLADPGAPGRMLPRGTTLADVAETATFLASDRAGGITAAVTTIAGGSVVG